MSDSFPVTEYVWKNAHGETLLDFKWGKKAISGYNVGYMQFQPIFEAELDNRISENKHTASFAGWEATDIREMGEYVELTIGKTKVVPGERRTALTDERKILRGRYLIGADGANSFVRQWLRIERDDLGFNEKWLVVDARKKRDLKFDFDCGQICDPKRPTTILPLGQRHRRWEWMMLPGESKEDLEKPETAWKLLAEQNVGPDDVEIVRQLVYTFEARDAHQMAPRANLFDGGRRAHNATIHGPGNVFGNA